MRLGLRVGFALTVGVVVIAIVVVAVAAIGFTPRPFSTGGESAVGMAQNSLGSRYTLDAAQLTAKWTFTGDTQVVLRYADGDASLDGQALVPGCYSGTISSGSVLQLDNVHGVSFAAPDSDSTCVALP